MSENNGTSESKSALRAQIFAAFDLKVEDITIPEWGDAELEVRSLGVDSYGKVLADCRKEDGKIDLDKFSLALVIACTHDRASKELVFTPADRDELAKKSPHVIGRIASVAIRLCGEDGTVTEKNSEPTTTGASVFA